MYARHREHTVLQLSFKDRVDPLSSDSRAFDLVSHQTINMDPATPVTIGVYYAEKKLHETRS